MLVYRSVEGWNSKKGRLGKKMSKKLDYPVNTRQPMATPYESSPGFL